MYYITCPKCEESLPETCYYADRKRKTGRRVYCKVCEAERHKRWRVETGKTKNPYSDKWRCDL